MTRLIKMKNYKIKVNFKMIKFKINKQLNKKIKK